MSQALETVRGKLGQDLSACHRGQKGCRIEQMTSINPAEPKQVIGHVALGTTEDVARAVAAARKAFSTWSRTSVEFRSRFLERLADKIAGNPLRTCRMGGL